MSRPPTPVSSCPLRRLQVRAGTETSVYEAAQFAGDMVLTLDGQRSLSTGRDCLMLVVHCSRRNMLSIRLSDLLLHHHGGTDSVGADRGARQLTIRIPSQHHEVRAAFEHARDFSLSLCMLNKSGFTIRDETLTSVSLDSSSPASNDLAPRLSSITPLPYGPAPQKPWTLASLLDSASVPPQSPTELMQNVPSTLSSQPILNASPRQTMPGSVLNPYNLFAKNQNGNLYQPRVASPLRKSFLPNEQGYEAGCVMTPVRGSENSFRSTSSTTIRGHDDSALFAASSSACSATESAAGDSTTFDAVEEETLVTRSFRDLMPQRRHLPFALEKQADMSPDIDKTKRVSQKDGDGYRLPLTPGIGGSSYTPVERRQGRQGGQNDIGHDREPDGSRQGFANLEDQGGSTNSGTGRFQETQASLLLPKTSDYVQHTVVLADSLMLRQLSNLTAGIFEQYQADVSRGCDEALCAQFYLERLQNHRREFWLSRLVGVDSHV